MANAELKLKVYSVEKIKLFAESVNFPILFSEGHVSFTTATLDIRIQHEFGWCLSKGLYTRLVLTQIEPHPHCVFKWILHGHLKPPPNATI